MKTPVITFTPGGTAHCLWTEAVPLGELGRLDVRRASQVEFNQAKQQWEVRDMQNNLLFANPSRDACSDWEHQYFNR